MNRYFGNNFLLPKQLTLLFFLLFSLPTPCASQEKIVEEVEVVNVEVVVRVYDNGKPVEGLKKEDFKLIAGEKEKAIHGFFEIRKKITVDSKKISKTQPQTHFTPRLFVLIFNVHTFTKEMNEALETLFQKIIQPNDRVMAFSNQHLLNEQVVTDPGKMKTQIREILEVQSNKMKKQIMQMEREVYLFSEERGMLGDIVPEHYYKRKYKQMRDEFLRCYFNPNLKEYTAIINYLREKKIAKWIFVFYQFGRFPDLIEKPDIFTETPEYLKHQDPGNISRSFIDTGATVHTLLMLPPIVPGNLPEGFKYELTTVPSEMILRDITKKTGGRVIQTVKIKKFFTKISEKEDIYYILTFEPGELKGKEYAIEIQTRNPHYRLVYDNGLRSRDFIKQMGKAVEENQQPSQTMDLNVILYDNRGIELAKEGQYEEAIAYFAKAIRFDPSNAHVYFNRGLTYYKMKQPENALSDYSAALELDPQYSDVWYNRGIVFLETQDYENAISDFTQVIRINPHYGSAYFNRAVAFEKKGKLREALQDYQNIKRFDPVLYSTYFTKIRNKIMELEENVEK